MFIGTYEHNMDSKNRVFVPVKFREELGETIYYRLYASKENPSIQPLRRRPCLCLSPKESMKAPKMPNAQR